MINYVLIADSPLDASVQERLQTVYTNHYQIADNVWVIKSNGSSEEISRTIFPREEKATEDIRHVVFRVSAWWGFHSRKLWEWMIVE